MSVETRTEREQSQLGVGSFHAGNRRQQVDGGDERERLDDHERHVLPPFFGVTPLDQTVQIPTGLLEVLHRVVLVLVLRNLFHRANLVAKHLHLFVAQN